MSYDELTKAIEAAPITWVPGLLRATVERAIKGGVFVPGGLEKFVMRVVDGVKG